MRPRWWTLPAALAVLVASACGVGGSTGDRGDASGSPASSVSTALGSTPVPTDECRGFAISLASTDVHGADTPDAAANSTRFGRPADVIFASTVWTTTSSEVDGVTLVQESGSVEVARMPDGSWYVVSGTHCG